MDKPVVKFVNVSKKYSLFRKKSDKLLEMFSLKKESKSFSALSNVSFEVFKGETIGIIGINGSGKSTLSSLLAQVTMQTSGTININGETSLVAISAGLNNHLTGMENIELKCMMHGLRKREIEEVKPNIIEFADIGDFINQPIKSYSSGMKSRLGFAISVHIQPDILVIDEALSVGDSTFYQKCLDKFKEFKKQGKTIFFISHSLSQVQNISDRILWLNFGSVKGFDESAKIADAYKNFINWFNKLTKQEQKEYRKKMLDSQKSDLLNEDSNSKEQDIYLSRSLKRRKHKKKRRLLLPIQLLIVLLLFFTSTVFMVVDNPVKALTSKFNTIEKSDGEPTNVETMSQVDNNVEINSTGFINRSEVMMYEDEERTVEKDTVSFANEVYVNEKIDNEVYKVKNDNSIGYIETDKVDLLEELTNSAVDLTIDDFLPLYPESFSDSYAFLFQFLNTEYDTVKNTLQGLTNEYVDEFGNQVLEFGDIETSYFFENNLSKKIEIDNINVENELVNEIQNKSIISSQLDDLYYIKTSQYNIVVNVKDRSISFVLI